jgi:hypothetical protein
VLTGLPDFGAPTLSGPARIIYPYGGGSFTVLPERLEPAMRADGTPELSLALVRGTVPELPPDPYGVIDIRLAPVHPLDEALALARQHRADATVQPVIVAGGFLRLEPATSDVPLPTPLTVPVPLTFDGLDRARFTAIVPMDTAVFTEHLLSGGTVALRAYAELEFQGVAPRLPVAMRFEPDAFLTAIAAVGDHGLVARDELVVMLATDLARLPVEVVGDANLDPVLLAATVVDWLRARYATLAPAPSASSQTYLRLPAEPPSGSVTWELSQPLPTTRPLVLDLDPLAGVREFVAAHGTGTLVTRSVVPPLATGELTVTVTANLPPVRLGVLELGIELVAPPRPPVRPQQSSAHAQLDPPVDTATLHLRLSPAEPPEFLSKAYAVVPGGGNEPLYGPAISRSGSTARLDVADFPLTFVPVRADPAVLVLSTVHVRFQPGDAALPPQDAELDTTQPSVAFTQPAATAGDGSLTVELRPLDGSPIMRLGPVGAAPLTIALALLPSYGPQEVTITGVFPEPDGLVAVDLVPEGRPEDPAWISTVALTPARPEFSWRYAAASPFHAGYRWRRYRDTPPPEPWSDVRPAGAPLTVEAEPQPSVLPAAVPIPPPTSPFASSHNEGGPRA